jgi:hypothetical protein
MIFTVDAKQTWQPTGITVPSGSMVIIKYLDGSWVYNPARPACTFDGNEGLPAKDGYALPEAPEGAVIGRLGDTIFDIPEAVGVLSVGDLELSMVINDDLENKYGPGLADNSGSIRVDIIIQTGWDFPVDATKAWQATGVIVPKGAQLNIKYQAGTWVYNSDRPACGAGGVTGLIAKQDYALPGAPEGALIGRLGDRTFLVGENYSETINDPDPAELNLVINDDLMHEYGAGLADNRGSITVRITLDVEA